MNSTSWSRFLSQIKPSVIKRSVDGSLLSGRPCVRYGTAVLSKANHIVPVSASGRIKLRALMLILLFSICKFLTSCEDTNIRIGDHFDSAGERRKISQQAITEDGGNKALALIVFYGEDADLDTLAEPENRQLLTKHYAVKELRLSQSYDEEYYREYWAARVRSGQYSSDLSFDFYLLHKESPYTVRDLEILHRYAVKKTPYLMVIDRGGNTLWASEQVNSRVLQSFIKENNETPPKVVGPVDPLPVRAPSLPFTTAAIRQQNYYALIIYVKDYASLQPLGTPAQDAADLSRVISDKYGFKVTMLPNAKRGDITGALAALRARLTPDDSLLIYFAGHGYLDPATKRGYWQPFDATATDEANWVSNDDIANYLKGMQALHVLVIADSCYSGTLTRGLGAPNTAALEGEASYVARMSQRRSRTALTSGGLEPVSDVGGGRNSVFARALIDTLLQNNVAQNMDSLARDIERRVVRNANQTPTYKDIRFTDSDDGDFVFVPRR